ncbi:hypothetical protein BDZ89DRAFT_1131920 [Hymenopellis radicata]|nr:hypothetical protein BDZ89DRAFT_1131920 [Hymenopellis radicata]
MEFLADGIDHDASDNAFSLLRVCHQCGTMCRVRCDEAAAREREIMICGGFTVFDSVTNIARTYHSSTSLTPNGPVMLAGSNPNDDATTAKYPTEYRMEFDGPLYLSQPRPTYTGLPATVNYAQAFTLSVTLPSTATRVSGTTPLVLLFL